MLAKLRSAGIEGILDYAAESDLPSLPVHQALSSNDRNITSSSRSNTNSAEAELDRHLEVTIRAIETASIVGGSTAVKVRLKMHLM